MSRFVSDQSIPCYANNNEQSNLPGCQDDFDLARELCLLKTFIGAILAKQSNFNIKAITSSGITVSMQYLL